MAWVLLFVGLIAITAGVRGQSAAAGKLLESEFTGPNSFIQWFLAIMILGLLGYYRPIKPVADAMIGLVIVGIVLSKSGSQGGNIFNAIEKAFQSATATPTKVASGSAANASSQSGLNLGGFTLPALPSLDSLFGSSSATENSINPAGLMAAPAGFGDINTATSPAPTINLFGYEAPISLNGVF